MSTEASTLDRLPANKGTQRKVRQYQQNQYGTCHCNCRRRASQDGESTTQSRRKSKATLDEAEHVSTVEPSIARSQSLRQRAQQPCPRIGRRPKPLQLRRLHSFLRDPTRTPVIAQQQARSQPSKNCTCESPLSTAQCALCVPRSACSWNVHHSVEELNRRHEEPDELLELPLHDHRDVTNQSTQFLYPALNTSIVPSV